MIELTTSNNIKVQLDDSDYFFFWKWSWWYNIKNKQITREFRHRSIYLSREIWIFNFGKILDNKEIDHIDRNTLNNQKYNLRLATRTEQNWNRNILSNNTSGYIGIVFNKTNNNWISRIRVKGIRIHLGSYNTPEEAALAYDKATKIYHGDFAILNFPENKNEY